MSSFSRRPLQRHNTLFKNATYCVAAYKEGPTKAQYIPLKMQLIELQLRKRAPPFKGTIHLFKNTTYCDRAYKEGTPSKGTMHFFKNVTCCVAAKPEGTTLPKPAAQQKACPAKVSSRWVRCSKWQSCSIFSIWELISTKIVEIFNLSQGEVCDSHILQLKFNLQCTSYTLAELHLSRRGIHRLPGGSAILVAVYSTQSHHLLGRPPPPPSRPFGAWSLYAHKQRNQTIDSVGSAQSRAREGPFPSFVPMHKPLLA